MTPRIVTSSFPTPWGQHFQAWCDRLGADTSPIGNGPTEAAAVAELQDRLADMAEYAAARAAANPPVWPFEERW